MNRKKYYKRLTVKIRSKEKNYLWIKNNNDSEESKEDKICLEKL